MQQRKSTAKINGDETVTYRSRPAITPTTVGMSPHPDLGGVNPAITLAGTIEVCFPGIPANRAMVAKYFPEYADQLIYRAEAVSHGHPCSALQRLIVENLMHKSLVKEGCRMIADVGGNAARAFKRDYVWTLAPLLDPVDALRPEPREGRGCRHLFNRCDCCIFDGYMSSYVLWFLKPEDVCIVVNKRTVLEKPVHFYAAVHEFSDVEGSLCNGEARYERFSMNGKGMVRMWLDGSSDVYEHPDLQWVQDTNYFEMYVDVDGNKVRIAMVWALWRTIESTHIYKFSMAPVGLKARAPMPKKNSLYDSTPVTKLNSLLENDALLVSSKKFGLKFDSEFLDYYVDSKSTLLTFKNTQVKIPKYLYAKVYSEALTRAFNSDNFISLINIAKLASDRCDYDKTQLPLIVLMVMLIVAKDLTDQHQVISNALPMFDEANEIRNFTQISWIDLFIRKTRKFFNFYKVTLFSVLNPIHLFDWAVYFGKTAFKYVQKLGYFRSVNVAYKAQLRDDLAPGAILYEGLLVRTLESSMEVDELPETRDDVRIKDNVLVARSQVELPVQGANLGIAFQYVPVVAANTIYNQYLAVRLRNCAKGGQQSDVRFQQFRTFVLTNIIKLLAPGNSGLPQIRAHAFEDWVIKQQPRKQKELRICKEKLEHGLYHQFKTTRSSLFVKAEFAFKSFSHEDNDKAHYFKPRGINALSPEAEVIYGPWGAAFQEYVMSIWNENNFIYLIAGSSNDSVGRYVTRLRNNKFVETDFKRFESSQHSGFYDLCVEIRKMFGAPQDYLTLMNAMVNRNVGSRQGLQAKWEATMLSGENRTLIDNSIITVFTLLYGLCHSEYQPEKGDLQEYLSLQLDKLILAHSVDRFGFLVQGDDTLIAVEKLPFRDYLDESLDSLGLLPDTIFHETVQTATFVSCRFYPVQDSLGAEVLMPAPKLFKLLPKMGFVLNVKNLKLDSGENRVLLKGKMLGLQKVCHFVPALREYISVVLSKLRTVEASEEEDKYKLTTHGEYLVTDATYNFIHLIYGVTRDEVVSFSNLLKQVQRYPATLGANDFITPARMAQDN
jgi:hypothetical protein